MESRTSPYRRPTPRQLDGQQSLGRDPQRPGRPTAVSPSSINRSNQVATDANVVAYLTAPERPDPGALRFMDIRERLRRHESNFVDPFDLAGITPTRSQWNNNGPVIRPPRSSTSGT